MSFLDEGESDVSERYFHPRWICHSTSSTLAVERLLDLPLNLFRGLNVEVHGIFSKVNGVFP
jgi:hypothetical protein